jgi:hypothetical protein
VVPFPAGDKDFVLFFETFRPSVGSHSYCVTGFISPGFV